MAEALFSYDKPDDEPTEVDKAVANELSIDPDAAAYFMQVWERNCFRIIKERRNRADK